MVGFDPRRTIAHELEKLGAEEPHRSGRQTVGTIIILCVLPDRLEIRAKDERGSVNQKNMIAGSDWASYRRHMFNRGHRRGAFSLLTYGAVLTPLLTQARNR